MMNSNKVALAAILIGIPALIVLALASSPFASRRETVYAIARELRKGMDRGEVAKIIDRHPAPFLNRKEGDQSITLWVHTGLIESCVLVIGFQEGILVNTRIHSEDDGGTRFPDAPPEIQLTAQK